MNKTTSTFTKELRKAKIQTESSSVDLAELYGCSLAFISNIETGKRKSCFSLLNSLLYFLKDSIIEMLIGLLWQKLPITKLRSQKRSPRSKKFF